MGDANDERGQFPMIIPADELKSWLPLAVRELHWGSGIIKLPWVWPAEEVAAFVAHLKGSTCYSHHTLHHSDHKPRTWEQAAHLETMCHTMDATVTAPHFMEYVFPLGEVAEALFGEPALLYSCSSFWTRPGRDSANPHIQVWHRDRDDRKFLALFMYGTDVLSDEDGVHLFAKGSHRNNDGLNRDPTISEPIEPIYGPAGTFFLACTSGLHLGEKPVRGERLLSWARWGVSEKPEAYIWDERKPVPWSAVPCAKPDESVQRKSTLVIDWNV